MLFLDFSNANVCFAKREFVCRNYTAAEALPTTQRFELISQKKFATSAIDPTKETFVMHVIALESSAPEKIIKHPSRIA